MLRKRLLPIAIGLLVLTLLVVVTIFIVRSVQARQIGARKALADANPDAYTLKMWRFQFDEDALNSSTSRFAERYPEYTFAYTRKNNAGTYEQDFTRSIAARGGPDILDIPDQWVQDNYSLISPLPTWFFDEVYGNKTDLKTAYGEMFPKGVARQMISETGKVLGIPTGINPLRLYWNPELFNEAAQREITEKGPNISYEERSQIIKNWSQPGTTWLGILNQTPRLTIRSGSGFERSAIAMGTSNNIPAAPDVIAALMIQNGASIISDDNQRAVFHIPLQTSAGSVVRTGQNALDLFTSFATPGKANYTWNAQQEDAVKLFAEGKLAMLIDFSDAKNTLATEYPNFKFSEAALPQVNDTDPGKTVFRFNADVITTSNPAIRDVAADMMAIYLTRASLRTHEAEFSPFLNELERLIRSGNSDAEFAEQIINGTSLFKPKRGEYNQIFKNMISNVNSGVMSPSQALDDAASRMNDLLFTFYNGTGS